MYLRISFADPVFEKSLGIDYEFPFSMKYFLRLTYCFFSLFNYVRLTHTCFNKCVEKRYKNFCSFIY